MVKQMVVIDGVKSGIIAEICTKSRKPLYITGYDKTTPRLFNNLEVAKHHCKMLMPDKKFKFHLKVEGCKPISINSCQIYNGTYQFFYDDMLYIVKEKKTFKTMSLGYIVLEDGDTVRCDKSYGNKHQYELMKIIRDVCTGILCENGDYSIVEIKKKPEEYILSVKGTTAKIHILHNSKLMDLNQSRKAQEKRCLPFLKTMDKFTTFYVYSDKDVSESFKIDGETKSNMILNYIIQDLCDYYPDLNAKYIAVEYNGFIELEEEY